MRYCFDIDGTICTTDCQYEDAKPYQQAIDWINSKYDEGHEITLYTSRGTLSGTDWFDFTLNQIQSWGIKYHKLKLGKPAYDLFVDDRAISNTEWYEMENIKI